MKYKYPLLTKAIDMSKSFADIYQPTSFWIDAAKDTVSELETCGIENFRTDEVTISNFFVPHYGVPTNSYTNEIADKITALLDSEGNLKQQLAMNEFLSGYSHALADYRVFIASDDDRHPPSLQSFSESRYGNPSEQFEFNNKTYSRSALNYLLGLCFLKKHLQGEKIKTVLEIGGGFGSLGEIFFHSNDIKYINVDIPPISFVSWNYLSQLYNPEDISSYPNTQAPIEISELPKCTVLNSWDIEQLEGEIDVFLNFISFQEMEPKVVENYFKHIKRLNPSYILLRNMREGKQKRANDQSHGVDEPILTENYIEMLADQYRLLDTNIHPYGYKTVDNFHSELLLFKRL